jgi:autotransporter-associated beta strand protein
LSGTGVLTKNGAGTLTLNSANTYSGGTVVDTGILNYGANGALGTGGVPTTPAATGRLVVGDGTPLTNSVVADSINPGAGMGFEMTADNTNGTVTTVTGPVTFNADAINGGHIAGPTSSGHLHFAGPVNLGGFGSSVSIRLGNVRLSGGGSYPEIQVRANTTSLGAHNGIAPTAVMDIAGNGSPTVPTVFDLNGFNQTLAGLKNVVAPANLAVVNNSSAMLGTLTLDLAANSQSFGGNIVGNLALTLSSGIQVLTGTNAYTGNTTVSGGTLAIAVPSVSANSTVSVASGAMLQLDFTTTNQVAGLILNGVSQPLGVYNSGTSPLYISGTGSLRVAEPSVATNPTNITAVVNGTQYDLSWPASHIGWILQSNSVSVASSASWFPVANSASTNRVLLNINPALPNVFFRLVNP